MPYGTVKVDNITFTNAGSDTTITVSGLLASTSGNLTVTGTVSGAVANFISGNFSAQLSGATITGNTGQFSNITGVSGVFTSRISGVTITGTTVAATTGSFVSLTGTTTQGTTATFTTGSFTSLTGTTTTGTTANFASGVFTTQISGATITGTTVAATTGTFTTVTGGVATITSGVFALGSAAAPSISFNSDPNTGIYSPGGDQVALVTSGTGRLFIDSSGNVGIGTSAPGTALDVNGTIRGTNFIADAGGYALFNNSDKTNYYYIQNNGATGSGNPHLAFIQGGVGERARIDSSGRLLVGTSSTSAASTLVLQGYNGNTADFSILRVCVGAATPTNGGVLGRIAFGDSAHSDGAWVEAYRDGGTWSGSSKPTRLVFSTTADGASSPTERLRIDSSGRLLVGTSSESGGALLQVNGDRVRIATAKTPASATDTGTTGEVCWDANYIYVCTGTNTWKRAALSTW